MLDRQHNQHLPLQKFGHWQGVRFALVTDGHTPHFRAMVTTGAFKRLFLNNYSGTTAGADMTKAFSDHRAKFAHIDWTRAEIQGAWIANISVPIFEAMRVLGDMTNDIGDFEPVPSP